MSIIEQTGKIHDIHLNGKSVLEIGCGCAEFSVMASKKANTVECIDLDNSRLLPEVNGIDNLSFHIMDAANLLFTDESFDTVAIYNAIGHLSAIIEQIIHESIRVLKNGGVFIIMATWKLDKAVIHEKVIPFFQANSVEYELASKGKTLHVVIRK